MHWYISSHYVWKVYDRRQEERMARGFGGEGHGGGEEGGWTKDVVEKVDNTDIRM